MANMEKHVLIVDDSVVSRMLLRGLIHARRPFWRISEAGSGEEALARARENPPDLVTLDIGMPGMNGLDLAVTLKEAHPKATLAIITANIQDSMRRRIQGLGILFVTVSEKPASPEAIDKMLYFLDAKTD